MNQIATPNSVAARDRAALNHPMTDLQRHEADGPIVVTRGDGVRVCDEDGRAFVEGVSGPYRRLPRHHRRLVERIRLADAQAG